MTIYDVAIAFCGRFGGARRAVGLVWVWWFVVARLVGSRFGSASSQANLPQQRQPTTTTQSDVKISKLNMPFPELEAQAAQALLTAVVAAGNLPGMGPGAKPTVMAPKGQVRSLVPSTKTV